MNAVHPPRREWAGPSPNVMHDLQGNKLPNMPLHRIVIHCTVSPCVDGGRYDIAALFRTRVMKSSHYVADPGGVVQVVGDHDVAEHAPPNPGSIGIEMCDALVSPQWDHDHAQRWSDADHTSMLNKVARLVARLGLAYDVPLARIEGTELQTARGICGHVDVSHAFGETDHWDPGPAFPWARFMKLVHEQANQIDKPS